MKCIYYVNLAKNTSSGTILVKTSPVLSIRKTIYIIKNKLKTKRNVYQVTNNNLETVLTTADTKYT